MCINTYSVALLGYVFCVFIAQCPTNLSIDNGFVMFSSDSKLVAYQCFDGFKLIGSTSAECMQDGKWSSSPPKCIGMIIYNIYSHVH